MAAPVQKFPHPARASTRPIPKPAVRELRAFALDPGCGRNYGNYMVLQVPFEDDLQPGPVGRYVAVVDYDSVNKCYYEPVDLNSPWILADDGLDPSESDPRFHQQMTYAVASETIRRFQFALGRSIHWRADPTPQNAPFHNKLLLMPHAIQEPNAYYDPELRAILFGYFTVSDKDPGQNLPGQVVFTCLAHDIVAHEMTHALLDGVRSNFLEETNPDVAAFHEAFADIIALLQHFSLRDAVLAALRGTRGTLFRPHLQPGVQPGPEGPLVQYELQADNPLVGLASQFGDALGLRGALRQMIGVRPNVNLLETLTEPHDRGSILVAAAFDAFFTIFLRRTEDLWRIAGIARDNASDIHPDLLARLADEASKTAAHFETLCIRALDYCPPVDITFGDYLRALITADRDLVSDDALGYRAALIDAFRSRGIRPQGVASYSEEALVWFPPDAPASLSGLGMVYSGMSRAEQREVESSNAQKLHAFAKENADLFGLAATNRLSVPSFHHVQRVGPEGNILFEMVAQIIERGEQVSPPTFNSGDERPQALPEPVQVLGGATVIFSPEGNVRYAIRKSLKKEHGRRQAEFRRQLWERTSRGPYDTYRNLQLDFRAIHRGF